MFEKFRVVNRISFINDVQTNGFDQVHFRVRAVEKILQKKKKPKPENQKLNELALIPIKKIVNLELIR